MSQSNITKPSRLPPSKLTPKQEKFAQQIALHGKTQTEAYRQAYDVKSQNVKGQWEAASHIASNDKVLARIEELKVHGANLLAHGIEKSAKKLIDLVDAKEKVVGLDGTVIGYKENTEMNRKAANDVLEKIGFGGGGAHTQVNIQNNQINIIMDEEAINSALDRLAADEVES